MYLGLLNEKEKKLFLDFAQCISASDGNIGVEETEMLSAYCVEMNISTHIERTTKTIDEIIGELSSMCDEKTKKIIIFELIGLALSDNSYDDSEKKMIYDAIIAFGLDKSYSQKCEEIISDYISFQNRINNLILG